MTWFVFDPDPVCWPKPSPVVPELFGPFETREIAEDYANVSHPDDGSGNTVVLEAREP